MREEHDIVEGEQRLRHVRLVGEDVEARGADRAGRERLDQRRVVDHRAAADIDQDAVRPERLQDTARRPRPSSRGVPGRTITSVSTASAMA